MASVGVANAMQASVHHRRGELGVLHAVGMTRGQLMRLILAEALIIGVAGAAGGVLSGAYGAFMGLRIASLFSQITPALTIPPGPTLTAVALAIAATVLASALAAFRAGRVGVLDLIRQ